MESKREKNPRADTNATYKTNTQFSVDWTLNIKNNTLSDKTERTVKLMVS